MRLKKLIFAVLLGLSLSMGGARAIDPPYQEEMERARAARVIDLGEVQLGPTLMLHGSAEQKSFYLPRIRSGEHVWCQGYSEPDAGSDLASLRTVAVS